jgi:hypothetical protein
MLLIAVFIFPLFFGCGSDDSSSPQTASNDLAMTATGTYTYTPATDTLSLNLTNSDFMGCGPDAGTSEVTILSITSDQLTWLDDDEQMVWKRDAGTPGDILGAWTYTDTADGNKYVINFAADGQLSIIGTINYCPGAIAFEVPHKTIVIDGDYSDWHITERVYQDRGEPECNDEPGLDIREFYVAQDEEFIYYRFVLNGPLNGTFAYRFGIGHRYLYVTKNNYAEYMVIGNSYTYVKPFLPNSFFHIDDNQFEAKFYKSDVANYWVGENFAAWCDQGNSTICRDYVDLPELFFDW